MAFSTWRNPMDLWQSVSIALFVIWCVSEIAIAIISAINKSTGSITRADKFSSVFVWLATIPAIVLAFLIRRHLICPSGFGDLPAPFPGILGCFCLTGGVAIRLTAVAALRRQFTTQVTIVERHKIVETGIYRILRHPAYLGYLLSLLGIGLVLGNWVSLAVLVVLPLAGILYRIRVEERVLLAYFGPAYQEYANRTKRLLPGIW
jgi:protein-S-isoprenylcysteine O-methyltransferase Ste14